VYQSFGGHNSIFDPSKNTILRLSQIIISDSSNFYENVTLELSQEYYSDFYSSKAYLPNLSLYSPKHAFSSNSSSCDNDNITSQHKYLFNIYINDTFGTFEKVEKKLDRYAIMIKQYRMPLG
ncbi:2541_t:CDS:2, partial [Gigaspora rosea]